MEQTDVGYAHPWNKQRKAMHTHGTNRGRLCTPMEQTDVGFEWQNVVHHILSFFHVFLCYNNYIT